MRRLKIAIDIDGVLRDFTAGVHDLMVCNGKWKYNEPAPKIDTWEMHQYYGMERDEFYNLLFRSFYTYAIFRFAPMYDGADKFIEELCEKHQVGLVSSQCHDGVLGTLRWLEKHKIILPSIHFVRFDLGDHDKTQFGYDILLDDKPSNVQQFIDAGKMGFLFDQPWNREVDLPRVTSYSQFIEIVNWIKLRKPKNKSKEREIMEEGTFTRTDAGSIQSEDSCKEECSQPDYAQEIIDAIDKSIEGLKDTFEDLNAGNILMVISSMAMSAEMIIEAPPDDEKMAVVQEVWNHYEKEYNIVRKLDDMVKLNPLLEAFDGPVINLVIKNLFVPNMVDMFNATIWKD